MKSTDKNPSGPACDTRISRGVRAAVRPICDSPAMSVAIVLCCMAPPAAAIFCRQWMPWVILACAAEGVALAFIASLAVAAVPRRSRRWLRLAITLTATFGAIVECIHIFILRGPLSSESAMLVANTNAREASGFFSQFFSSAVIVFSATVLAIGVFLCIWAFQSKWRVNLISLPAALTLIAAAIAGTTSIADLLSIFGVRNIEERIRWEVVDPGVPSLSRLDRFCYAPPFPKLIYIVKNLDFDRRDVDTWLGWQDDFFAVPAISEADRDLEIIVVVGESFIKSHTPLYGYHLPTTPRLCAERDSGNLVPFTDMITTANFTTISLRNLFNLNTINGVGPMRRKWTEAPYFPAVMKRAGFRVDFFTNQFLPGGSDDLSRLFFSPLALDSIYTRHNTRRTGDDLVFIREALADGGAGHATPRLSIFHLEGQHFPPSWHYPPGKEFEIFTASDIPANRPWLDADKRAVVAQYANATHYNDRVIGTIIDAFRSRNAVLIYFSDHGEEMYDSAPFGNRNAQHPDDPEWIHRQFDIPFMIWMSPEFQRRNPEEAQAIRSAAGRAGDLGDLGQSVLWLAKVKSRFSDPRNTIIAPQYVQPARRVTAMGYQYPLK